MASSNVPEWAQFFTPEQFQQFLNAVTDELDRRNIPHRITEDSVVAQPDPEGEEQTWGLVNLAKLCRMGEPRVWTPIISDHFDTVTSIKETELQEISGDFEKARKLLKVLLQPGEFQQVAEKAVCRQVAESIVAALVLDLPAVTATVPKDKLEEWNVTADQLFDEALSNTLRDHPPHPKLVEEEDLKLILLREDHFFVASHVMRLDQCLPNISEHGVIVGIPHQHTLIFHVIEDYNALGAIQKMLPVVMGIHNNEPHPISNQLYWWKDGKLILLPTGVKEGQIEFTPPPDFVDLLNKFAPEE